MFNPRLYGVAQGSLIAKSIHQEDLQCNESSVRSRRKALPPKVASSAPKTFSPGRGGRGGWRGRRGFVRGRGGGSGHFASSRNIQKSQPQVPTSPSPRLSFAPVTMSNEPISPVASGAMSSASSSVSHPPGPRHSPKQLHSWKGKAVVPVPPGDENPRPTKRQRTDLSSPGPVQSRPPGSHYSPCDHGRPSTRPRNAEDGSTPASGKNVNTTPPPRMPLNAPNSISNANSISQTKEFSHIPPWRSRAMKQKLDPSSHDPGERFLDPAQTTRFNTNQPSSQTSIANPVLPPADDAPSSYQPPCTEAAAGSQCPSNAAKIVSHLTSTNTVNPSNPPVILPNTHPHKSRQPLSRNTSSNSATLADQRGGHSRPSSQRIPQPSDQSLPRVSTNPNSRTANQESLIIPRWAQATRRKKEISTESPSTRTLVADSAVPLPAQTTPLYQPSWKPTADAEESKCPQSFSSVMLNDTNGPAQLASITDAFSSHKLNATLVSSRPGSALNNAVSAYDASQRPQKKSKSIESYSTISSSSDNLQILSPPTTATYVKKESSPPSLPPEKSPVPLPAAPVKSENAGPSMTENYCVSAEFKDPIVIKQEPDLVETIIPRRKLVTESCSFYPIPQNCRKSVPNYKNNRIEYFRKEYKKLREFGLTKQKVIFRDDGLAIEWTSPIPVWSDTLLPEAST